MPAIHPAYVLRFPTAFRDLAFAVDKLHKEPCKMYDLGYVPYSVITNESQARIYLETLRDSKVTLDIETGHVGHTTPLLAVGLTDNIYHATILPGKLFDCGSIRSAFEAMVRRNSITIQNADFEVTQFIQRMGIEIETGFDTLLGHYILDERSGDDDNASGAGRGYHGLKTLGGLYFDAPDWSKAMDPYKADYSLAPTDTLYRYLALDLSVTHNLREVFEREIIGSNMLDPLRNVIFPAIKTLTRMEVRGARIDLDYFDKLDDEWQGIINENTERLQHGLGKPNFNVNSPKQVAELLFDEFRMKKIDGRSTNSKHVIPKLLELYPDNEYLKAIADLRKTKHIHATYIRGIPSLADSNARVHTRFLLHGSDTGRLASRGPNLQNIPSRIGSAIRDGFIATEGYDLLNCDYKQLEFRVLAYFSQDPQLISFIQSGRSIHYEVACQYFNCTVAEVDKSRLLDAKAVVFGIIYQRTIESICEEFKLTREEGKRRVNIIKEMFPKAFEWIEETKANAIRDMQTLTTPFGRIRRFPLITNRNREEIMRQAVNTPIQSTASDICLTACRRIVDKDIEGVHPIILVHDSILMEIPKHSHRYIPLIVDIMEQDPFPTPVKFAVEAEIGERWGSLEKIK